ncbi:MAG TPA: flavin reductase family protein [Jatrophihabitans sp.]|nr:flavin reductase family protein [Jatrophihabitans sp.]
MEPTARPAAATVEQYRALMSAFPTGVAVVTASDESGHPFGMTCSSLTSVTLAPPVLLICLRLGSRTEATVRRRGAFAVNLLRSAAQATAELFAGPVGDRFARVPWAVSPSGLPWLTRDAFAVADCVVIESIEVGDHAVLFGRVGCVLQRQAPPLLYGLRRFSAWNPIEPPTPACPAASLPDPPRREKAP